MKKAVALSDSVADVNEDLKKCPECGSVTQLDHGTCINCLLREGLEASGLSSAQTDQVMGGNFLRLFGQVFAPDTAA